MTSLSSLPVDCPSFATGVSLTGSIGKRSRKGKVSVNAGSGSFEYTPNADFFGTDTFTYRANDGADSNVATVTITVNDVNDPPVADPNGPYNGTAGVELTLDGSGSSDVDGTIVTYEWDFGDGNNGTGVAPTHTYAADGSYTVSLTVTDDDGATTLRVVSSSVA